LESPVRPGRASVTTETIATAAFMVLFTYDSTKLPSFAKGNAALGRELALGTASYGAENLGLAAAGLKLASVVMFNVNPAGAAEAAKLPKEEPPLFIMQVGSTQ
jgi:hypothetical protein